MRDYVLLATIALLCMIVMPTTQAHASNGNGNNGSTTTAAPQQAPEQQKASATKATPAKKTTKPREKSVLDSEVLESPISYFRDAFSSGEDESDTASRSSAVVITVKTLIATLLSTVM